MTRSFSFIQPPTSVEAPSATTLAIDVRKEPATLISAGGEFVFSVYLYSICIVVFSTISWHLSAPGGLKKCEKSLVSLKLEVQYRATVIVYAQLGYF